MGWKHTCTRSYIQSGELEITRSIERVPVHTRSIERVTRSIERVNVAELRNVSGASQFHSAHPRSKIML